MALNVEILQKQQNFALFFNGIKIRWILFISSLKLNFFTILKKKYALKCFEMCLFVNKIYNNIKKSQLRGN